MSLTGDLKPPLTLEQLAYLFRLRMDDLPGDVVSAQSAWQNDDSALLWSNEEICVWADEAQHEFAARRPILDSTTAAICQIGTTANQQTVTYDNRIIYIDRVKWVETSSDDEFLLEKKDQHWMDDMYVGWDKITGNSYAGQPCNYVDYVEENKLKLWRIPEGAGTLHMTVYRYPINRLTWTQRHKALEIDPNYHMDLLDWMQFRAYTKRDAETENPDLAAQHEATFERRIGVRPSAHLQTVRRRERRMGRRVRARYV